MKNLFLFASALGAAICFTSCSKEEEFVLPTPGGNETEQPEQPGDDNPGTPTVLKYNEPFRPQIHYTPERNWINDPNGMVYLDGTWHLFYQYNPYGNQWGNMSWGHATSTDLMHWKEQDVALVKDELGDIFSGSCVIDKNNTAGFGAGAMVAFFTSAGARQQQSMAYSTDGGKNFYKYGRNPIIANTDMDDFRDPKVFWDEENHQWVMSLARGWTYAIDFYTSPNLKEWKKSGTFSTPGISGCNGGQWECPDLLTLTAPDGTKKNVLIVSVNPGGPNGGSGTYYFVGNWDGNTFTADQLTDTDGTTPLWFDYGCDNYAGVTWSNAPGGRCVFIGWMNNWSYSGDVPCNPSRSAMTLPRELCLVNTPGGLRLSQSVVKELDGIAGQWTDVTAGTAFPEGDAYHLQVTVDLSKNSVLTLASTSPNPSEGGGNGSGEVNFVDITFNLAMGAIQVKRQKDSGQVGFNGSFSRPGIRAYYSPTMKQGGEMTVDLYIDRCSLELITGDGTLASTNLLFPEKPYNSASITGQALKARVRALKNVWR